MAASNAIAIDLPQRRNTRGWAKVPYSIIENAALLTHAELALALIVARRSESGESCTVSDDTWTKWTGLKARAKEYAIRGLKEKGLQMDGRGAAAKYTFAWPEWHKFVLRATPPEVVKPRTPGRAVKAEPGTKIHEDCAKTGCAKLCGECETAQPVAQAAAGRGLVVMPSGGAIAQPVARNGKRNKASRGQSASAPIAQPVARNVGNYKKTLEEIQRRFPTAGERFVLLLVDKLQARFQHVPEDGDLAKLIAVATKKSQHSEGMYLETVPAVYAVWLLERGRQEQSTVSAASFGSVIEGLRGLLDRERTWFAPVVLPLIDTLQTTNWSSMSQVAIGSVLIDVQKPLTDRVLRKFEAEPDYLAVVDGVSRSLREAGMPEGEIESQLAMRLEILALEKYRVPYVWPE